MSSVKRRITVEEYEGGGYGCPDLNLMGYTDLFDLLLDIYYSYKKLSEKVV